MMLGRHGFVPRGPKAFKDWGQLFPSAAAASGIDRPLIERLFELEFVDRAENVLFKRGSGLGKTMFALNVGQAALAEGFTLRFSTLAAALADLHAKNLCLPSSAAFVAIPARIS
jgi:hypothetical protein